ncbi:ubiquitin carboxyl-terminal hydrolase 16-like isoform X4 [Lytechinus variegatus]|uniref:ubiquitin carboxyl-terminal hydrolase 16-like isoform X2 n=1 Tax=Lytechinus variegatus TaxID=7654 RepID=UPI001BB1350B|nr:ubiquitin carboxyl-terminal hydrolase 16-like isoform X2 [Lytechinus variegatus]XP_041461941.1 ubiquitin carboxyl-terminal hydrolase 16-like isoform X3 [Lytechinus variegatus]XP_041461942.1 ubiquitin carboxyl-terminal hydrolase 16-like isoform X4 [Lytechinus variegatus]
MRVKEGATGPADMGKKRNRTKQTDYHNTSDEETVKGKECTHLEKSVSLTGVKKGLKNYGFGQCSSCTSDKGSGSSVKKSSPVDEVDGDVFEPVIWLCLACGSQGCCRNSPAQHALKHFETPRTGSHSVAVCLANWNVWCYKCDDAISPSESKKLGECMDWIKKQAFQQKPAEKSASKKKSKEADVDESHVRTSSSPIRSPLLTREGSLPKVRGLNNLGNTCFFNAVMQNLTQTHVLRDLLHEKWSSGKQLVVPTDTHLSVSTNQNGIGKDSEKEPLVPITITVAPLQPLTSSLIEFLDEMQKPTKSTSINPRALFNQVCNKASRFKGYQQQDSHELLRYLLDGMKAEEIKRMQQGLTSTFDVKKAKVKNLDEATKKKIKEYGNHSKHTFVDTVFGGHLISSVKCNECLNISEILEPFLDLSLPITEAKGSKRNLSSSKSLDRPSMNDQQMSHDGDKQTLAATAAAASVPEETKLSKHQMNKQKEKAKKEARRKTKKNRTLSQSEDPIDEKKDSPIQSDNEEEERREEGVGYRDPNDADSEASVLDRLSNAGSSRRCSEQTAAGDVGIGGLPNNLPEVPSEKENEEAHESQNGLDKVGSTDRLSLSSRASTSSSSSRLSPLPQGNSFKALGDELSATTDDDKRTGSEEGKVVKESGTVKNIRNKMASLGLQDSEKRTVKVEERSDEKCEQNIKVEPSVNENGKEAPKVNGTMDDSDDKAGENGKDGSDMLKNKEEPPVQNGVESDDPKIEKLHGGNERTLNGPSGIAPLAKIHELGESLAECNNVDSKKSKIHELGESLAECNNVDSKKSKNTSNAATKEESTASTTNKNSGSKMGKTKPHPISTQTVAKLNAMSPPVSPVSPTSRARVASTLAPRYQSKNQECSVMSCLNQFTAPELLTGTNKFGCETCTKAHKVEGKEKVKYTDASKQLLIHQPPPILTLHLKRFQQVGYNLRKITRHIEFPSILDVAPFCSTACKRYANSENRVLYSLYGVVEHSGRLQFGHYTAFVKVRQPNQTLTLYTLGIPRTLNLLNETCDRQRTEKNNEERLAKEKLRSSGKKHEEGSDGENMEKKPESQNKTSNSVNHLVPERNHIQSAVLPFHAGRNVSVPVGKWYHISDTHVTEVNESKVLNAQAYILFYERLIS